MPKKSHRVKFNIIKPSLGNYYLLKSIEEILYYVRESDEHITILDSYMKFLEEHAGTMVLCDSAEDLIEGSFSSSGFDYIIRNGFIAKEITRDNHPEYFL